MVNSFTMVVLPLITETQNEAATKVCSYPQLLALEQAKIMSTEHQLFPCYRGYGKTTSKRDLQTHYKLSQLTSHNKFFIAQHKVVPINLIKSS